ncbi:Forkhead-associated (FHA) domain [Macleaya cordata]|uniref:Forkhead-associated (FHA) domain n=1 Tax=Macleaya cordata TaxID=56857 RepID=A0A200PYC6_MACCD|nr:Forkhead-associated (FHA) domain [Macleaya cordata]
MMATTGSHVEVGFAKLHGEDFEYYMQTYSIILGRNSKTSTVDVDLYRLGGGINISRHHARILYDFQRRHFALEVIGINGCFVEGVHHHPGDPPVKLNSQELLQIGDKKFYFLLPVRSILGGSAVPHHIPNFSSVPRIAPPAPSMFGSSRGQIRAQNDYDDNDDEDDEEGEEDGYDDYDDDAVVAGASKKLKWASEIQKFGYGARKAGSSGQLARGEEKSDTRRSRVSREAADNHQLLQLEEKDVVSSVATVLSDLCGPGEWMPMAKLHTKLVKQYGSIWHHSRVRRYLTSEDWPKGRPWFSLLALLRKYPEHFVINTRSKGRVTSEFVSLVSLLS